MTLQWIVAFSHLLALGIGMGAVWARGRALRGTLDDAGLKNVFYADMVWHRRPDLDRDGRLVRFRRCC